MKSNTLKYAMILSIIVIVIAISLAYFSWNRTGEIIEFKQSHDAYVSGIDKCQILDGKAWVKGWTFPKDRRSEGNIVVGLKDDEKIITMPTFSFKRKDVSSRYSRTYEYDNVGFNASLRNSKINNKNINTIYIFDIQSDGSYVEAYKHECN